MAAPERDYAQAPMAAPVLERAQPAYPTMAAPTVEYVQATLTHTRTAAPAAEYIHACPSIQLATSSRAQHDRRGQHSPDPLRRGRYTAQRALSPPCSSLSTLQLLQDVRSRLSTLQPLQSDDEPTPTHSLAYKQDSLGSSSSTVLLDSSDSLCSTVLVSRSQSTCCLEEMQFGCETTVCSPTEEVLLGCEARACSAEGARYERRGHYSSYPGYRHTAEEMPITRSTSPVGKLRSCLRNSQYKSHETPQLPDNCHVMVPLRLEQHEHESDVAFCEVVSLNGEVVCVLDGLSRSLTVRTLIHLIQQQLYIGDETLSERVLAEYQRQHDQLLIGHETLADMDAQPLLDVKASPDAPLILTLVRCK